MPDLCVKSSKISGINSVIWLSDVWMEGIWQWDWLFFPPEAISMFSGDSSRTRKAALGNLTHGLQWMKKKKKSESILIFLKANWGMKPQTKIVRGKPTIKIGKGKGSKFYCIWEWKVCTLELGWWQWLVLCLVFYPSLQCQDQREDKCWIRGWKISWKYVE